MGTHRTGIYCRISQDREGAGLGVARQEEDARAFCSARDWEVVEVYVDNDTSAYSGKPRPAYQRMLGDIENGHLDAVVCWHVDRLTRTPVELEHVIDIADRTGLLLGTVTGEVDLSTPTGRMVARIIGATARQESEHKAERQKRQRRQAAEAGHVAGGGTRPYGYDDDRLTIVETEADAIRDAASRILAGESLSSICRDWADRGVRTSTGGSWRPTTLRRLLASARISGRREYNPRPPGQTTRPLLGEIVADAVWPAIIPPEQSDQIRRMLSDPNRRRTSSATGRTYLLSGILRCGRCGHGMVGRPKSGTPRYVCPNVPGGQSCGGTATVAERTDEHVRDLVLIALSSPDLAARLREVPEVDQATVDAVRDDEGRLEELAEEWADGNISRAEWRRAREVIEGRLERNRAILNRQAGAAPLADLVGTFDDLLARWQTMNVSQRRAVVGAVLDRVEVGPANRRMRWDPDRFTPVWKA